MHRDPAREAAPRSLEQERGQTMPEYAVVLSIITITIMTAIVTLGDTAGGIIEEVASFL